MDENISKNETKRGKFIRIAEKRVNNILEQFRKLGNLSNERNYEYTEEDVSKMFSSLNKALRNTRALYYRKGGQKSTSFKF